jgi:hypothetical protein
MRLLREAHLLRLQGPHPDPRFFNHGEPSAPVRSRPDGGHDRRSRLTWRAHRQPKQDDATAGRQTLSNGELAEILVERQQDPPLRDGTRENRVVCRTRCIPSDPRHIVAGGAQGLYGVDRKILIRKEAHRQLGSRARVDALLAQRLGGVVQAGLHVLVRESGIVSQDFVLAPSLRKQLYYELDGQPGAAHHRLSCEHSWIDHDVFTPVHGTERFVRAMIRTAPCLRGSRLPSVAVGVDVALPDRPALSRRVIPT